MGVPAWSNVKQSRCGNGLLFAVCCRLSSLSLSRYVTVSSSQLGGLKWLDLDTVEQRYLLTAAADSTVQAFDILVCCGGH